MADEEKAPKLNVTRLMEHRESRSESDRDSKEDQKRTDEVEAEIEEGGGPIESAADEDISEIDAEIENAADEIVKDGTSTEIESGSDAQEKAEDIAEDLEKIGIHLTDEQVNGLSDKIWEKVKMRLDEVTQSKSKQRDRKPDRRPKATHWSERTMSLRRGGDR